MMYEKIDSIRYHLKMLRYIYIENNTDAEMKRITEILENKNLGFKESDDSVVKRIVECIRVMDDSFYS